MDAVPPHPLALPSLLAGYRSSTPGPAISSQAPWSMGFSVESVSRSEISLSGRACFLSGLFGTLNIVLDGLRRADMT